MASELQPSYYTSRWTGEEIDRLLEGGNMVITERVDSLAALSSKYPGGQDGYYFANDTKDVYWWDKAAGAWVSLGNLEGPKGETGDVLVPHISEAGFLTWTVEKTAAVPDPLNIIGPVGPTGPTGPVLNPTVSRDGTLSWTVSNTPKAPAPVNIRGPVGPNGPGTGDMLKSTYDPQGRETDVFAFVEDGLQRKSDRNYLRNPYFVPVYDNGKMALPVNQRGVSGAISTPGYFIDMWRLISGTVEITAAGLVLTGTMEQILEVGPDRDFTASVLTSTGVLTARYDKQSKTFSVTASGQTLIAAKLELGPVQTLAHKEGDAWVLNDPPPDPATELAKCQRYYWRNGEHLMNYYYPPCLLAVAGQTGGPVSFANLSNSSVVMRAVPTVRINGVSPGESVTFRDTSTGATVTGTLLEPAVFSNTEQGLSIIILKNTTGTFTIGQVYEAMIERDANL